MRNGCASGRGSRESCTTRCCRDWWLHCFKGTVMTVATNSVSDSCSSNLFLRRAGKAQCPRAEGSRTTLPQTFDELAATHAKRIFRAAYRITRNRQDAEDAVQDALLQAFVHLKHFEGRSTFATWLTRIAINSSLMICASEDMRGRYRSRKQPILTSRKSFKGSETKGRTRNSGT